MSPGDIRATLLRARERVERGWSEPWSLDVDGRIWVPALDAVEGPAVASWCLWDALESATAWAALEAVTCPRTREFDAIALGGPPWSDFDCRRAVAAAQGATREATGLNAWLEAPGRLVGEVVRLLNRALARGGQTA